MSGNVSEIRDTPDLFISLLQVLEKQCEIHLESNYLFISTG